MDGEYFLYIGESDAIFYFLLTVAFVHISSRSPRDVSTMLLKSRINILCHRTEAYNGDGKEESWTNFMIRMYVSNGWSPSKRGVAADKLYGSFLFKNSSERKLCWQSARDVFCVVEEQEIRSCLEDKYDLLLAVTEMYLDESFCFSLVEAKCLRDEWETWLI